MGFAIWSYHADKINGIRGMAKTPPSAQQGRQAQALLDLCAGVLPVWGRQLASSRAQSEVAVSQMLQAFADIGPHIDMAERQSVQIHDALNPTDDGVTGLARACDQALSPLLQDASLSPQARAAIAHVLELVSGAVTALENISQPGAQESRRVAEQVERMYLGFQYQDRISQMMALLESDMARLQQALGGAATEVLELEGWLARLESQYAMAEQRQNHAEKPGGGAGDNTETTFF